MAGESGGQDWWGLLYLFFAGIVSIAVDVVRRLTSRIGEDDPPERHHRRAGDTQDHHHRRKDDPPEEDE